MNLRKSPDKTSEVIGKKLQGEMIFVDMSEEENGFVPVKTDHVCEKVLGYVWSGFLSDQPKQSNSNSASKSSSGSFKSGNSSRSDCGPGGVTLYRGSRGGCYYLSGRSKVYVDRSCCN